MTSTQSLWTCDLSGSGLGEGGGCGGNLYSEEGCHGNDKRRVNGSSCNNIASGVDGNAEVVVMLAVTVGLLMEVEMVLMAVRQ